MPQIAELAPALETAPAQACRTELVGRIAADQAAALGGLVPPALRATYAERLVELHGLGYLGMTAIYRRIVNELALDGGHRRLHPRRLTTDFERRLAASSALVQTMERPTTGDATASAACAGSATARTHGRPSSGR